MYCKNCGKKLNDDDRFCPGCGFKAEQIKKPLPAFEVIGESKPERHDFKITKFDWDLDGYPDSGKSHTEDVDFNWESVIDKKKTDSVKDTPAFSDSAKQMVEAAAFDWTQEAGELDRTRHMERRSFVPPVIENLQQAAETDTGNEIEVELPATQTSGDDGVDRLIIDIEEIKDGARNAGKHSWATMPEMRMDAAAVTAEMKEGIAAGVAAQQKKIDKFYTFNKKNEEFQALLDQEYERLRERIKEEAEAEEIIASKEAALEKARESWDDEKIETPENVESVDEDAIPENVESIIEKAAEEAAEDHAGAENSGYVHDMPEDEVKPEDLHEKAFEDAEESDDSEEVSETEESETIEDGSDGAYPEPEYKEVEQTERAVEQHAEPETEPDEYTEKEHESEERKDAELLGVFDEASEPEHEAEVSEVKKQEEALDMVKPFEMPETEEAQTADETESESGQEQESGEEQEKEPAAEDAEIAGTPDELQVLDMSAISEIKATAAEKTSGPDNDKQETDDGESKEEKTEIRYADLFDDDDVDEGGPKSRKIKLLLLDIMIVILAVCVVVSSIVAFAPNSKPGLYLKDLYAKIMQSEQPSPNTPGEEPISKTSIIEAAINSQKSLNVNIKEVKEDTALVFDQNKDYGIEAIKTAKAIEDVEWYKTSDGKIVKYGEAVVGTLISYYSSLSDRINKGSDDVFGYIEEGSDLEGQIKAITPSEDAGENAYVINTLQIGEIRENGNTFYALVRVEETTKDQDKAIAAKVIRLSAGDDHKLTVAETIDIKTGN